MPGEGWQAPAAFIRNRDKSIRLSCLRIGTAGTCRLSPAPRPAQWPPILGGRELLSPHSLFLGNDECSRTALSKASRSGGLWRHRAEGKVSQGSWAWKAEKEGCLGSPDLHPPSTHLASSLLLIVDHKYSRMGVCAG